MTESIRVLHVDDNPDFTDLAATFLERADDRFVVETTTGTAAGLDRLAGGSGGGDGVGDADIDCVVSDYDMPDRDGIDFLEAVRDRYDDLPFILFTGKGSEEIASEAISAGVTDYLPKGRETDRYELLAHRLSNAVDAHRSRVKSETRRRRLEGILKTAPGCITQLGRAGEFVFVNDRAEEVLGLERADVTDRTYNDPEWRIRDLDGEPIPDDELPFRRVRDTGEPIYGYRHSIEWPDGSQKELLINGAPLFDDGQVESVVFSMVDVTDRRERERTFKETKKRLELATEATGTGVWEWDLQTDTVVWDETLERVMGLEPGAFEGTYEAFAERVHPDDLPAVERKIERSMKTGGEYRTEFRMLRPDGEVLWVEGRAQVFDDGDGDGYGNGTRLIGIHHDITERKRRERELERTKRRLDDILENTPMPMFLKSADGAYLLVNRTYCELFGLENEDVIGHTDEELHPPDVADGVRANDLQVISRGEPLTAEERIVADGEERTYLTTKVPIYGAERGDGDGDGDDSVAVFGVAKDITEREAYRTELERRNELLEEFAAVVSHDLRSPLTVAQGRIKLATEECDSADLDAAAEALERCQTLIDDLLQLARNESGTVDMEPVVVADAVRECWRTVETEDATLKVETTRTIRADRSRLQQLLQNLVRNAVEHGGSNVTISVGDLPDGFYVADDGPGIPADERDDVFETGYSTTARNTGFGLGIVQRVALDHGWSVTVIESRNGGARFEVTGAESA